MIPFLLTDMGVHIDTMTNQRVTAHAFRTVNADGNTTHVDYLTVPQVHPNPIGERYMELGLWQSAEFRQRFTRTCNQK